MRCAIIQIMKPTTWTDRTIMWLIYAIVSMLLIGYFGLTHSSIPTIIGLTTLFLLLPLLFTKADSSLLLLIILRPVIDTFSGYTIITIQDISLNMNAMLGLAVVGWGIFVIIKEQIRLRSIPGIFWLGGMLLASVLSLTGALSLQIALSEFLRFASLFMFYILALHFSQADKHFLHRAINALALSAVLPIVVAIEQLLLGSGLSTDGISNRIYGTFGHPNVLGFYMVLLICMLLIVLLTTPKHPRFLTYPLVLIGGIFAITFTYTRGAWLGLGIILLVLGWKYYRKPLLLSAMVITMLFFFGQTINTYTMSTFNFNLNTIPLVNRVTRRNDEADSIQWRIDVFNEMAPKTLARPWFGYGLGNFVTLRQQGDLALGEATEAHNDYLRLAIEIGFIGLACYLLFWLSLLRQTVVYYLIYPKNSWQKQYTLAIGALVIAFLAMSLSDNMLQGTPVMWSLLLMIGSVLGANQLHDTSPITSPFLPKPLRPKTTHSVK